MLTSLRLRHRNTSLISSTILTSELSVDCTGSSSSVIFTCHVDKLETEAPEYESHILYYPDIRERDTNVENLVESPTIECGQIHLNPAAIWFMPTPHFDRQSAFSFLKLTSTLSSSTCFFHVLLSLPFFL